MFRQRQALLNTKACSLLLLVFLEACALLPVHFEFNIIGGLIFDFYRIFIDLA